MDAQAAVDRLRGPLCGVGEARAAGSGGLPSAPGLYAWWVAPGAIPGVEGPDHPIEAMQLLYLGIAPKNSESRSSIRSRVRGQHLGGNIGSSTFRQSLAALLFEVERWEVDRTASRAQLAPASNRSLSRWQELHLRISWVECEAPWEIENEVIARMSPPLNLAGNASHPLHQHLSARRRLLRAGTRQDLSHTTMHTLGIDLSSDPRKTAACVVEWDSDGAHVLALHQRLANVQLLAMMRDADHIGIDAPFGWPSGFVEAIAKWAANDQWSVPWPDDEALRSLRLRETDLWIRATLGKEPLSVSSTGIAITAWRAAALLTAFHNGAIGPLDRVRGRAREVYPGAALIAWQHIPLKATESYKSSLAARATLVARLAPPNGWLDIGPQHREELAASDHRLDALVSALVSRAAAIGLTSPPPVDVPPEILATEGWIAQPTPDSWAKLASA